MRTTQVLFSLLYYAVDTMALLGLWQAFSGTRLPLKRHAIVGLVHTTALFCYHMTVRAIQEASGYSDLWSLLTGPSFALWELSSVMAFYPFELMLFLLVIFIGFRDVYVSTRLWTAVYAYTAHQGLLLLLGALMPDAVPAWLGIHLPIAAAALLLAAMRRWNVAAFTERHALTLRIICSAVVCPFMLWSFLIAAATPFRVGHITGVEVIFLIPYVMALLGLLFIGITAWIIHKEQKRTRLRSTADRMTDLNRFIDESRQNTHDFNKHIRYLRNTVHVYCERGDTDGLVQEVDRYCEELLERSEKDEILLHLDDPTLRAILYGRRAEASAAKVLFIIDATPLLPHFPVRNYELVEMVDNLMDNAFDGVRTAEGHRFIRVILSCEPTENDRHRHLLCIQNPCTPPNMDQLLTGQRFTTKGGRHQGIGLSKVSRLAANTGGKLILSYEDGIFSAKIVYEE